MVLGFVAALGTALAGYGIYKGSTDAGKAAKMAGQGAEDALRTLSKEITQMRVFMIETAWPEINKTLLHCQRVMETAEVLLVTSTFTVKVLALFLALCAAYMTHKITTGRNAIRPRHLNDLSTILEDTVLLVMYCLCVLIALVLVLELIKELLNVSLLNSFPIVILIPSLTTLAVVYRNIVIGMKALFKVLRYVYHVIIEIPINFSIDPVTKGSCYMYTRTNLVIKTAVCIFYALLYSSIPYGACLLILNILQRKESFIKRILVVYGVIYAATLMITVIGMTFISHFIRPIWGFFAKRNTGNVQRSH